MLYNRRYEYSLRTDNNLFTFIDALFESKLGWLQSSKDEVVASLEVESNFMKELAIHTHSYGTYSYNIPEIKSAKELPSIFTNNYEKTKDQNINIRFGILEYYLFRFIYYANRLNQDFLTTSSSSTSLPNSGGIGSIISSKISNILPVSPTKSSSSSSKSSSNQLQSHNQFDNSNLSSVSNFYTPKSTTTPVNRTSLSYSSLNLLVNPSGTKSYAKLMINYFLFFIPREIEFHSLATNTRLKFIDNSNEDIALNSMRSYMEYFMQLIIEFWFRKYTSKREIDYVIPSMGVLHSVLLLITYLKLDPSLYNGYQNGTFAMSKIRDHVYEFLYSAFNNFPIMNPLFSKVVSIWLKYIEYPIEYAQQFPIYFQHNQQFYANLLQQFLKNRFDLSMKNQADMIYEVITIFDKFKFPSNLYTFVFDNPQVQSQVAFLLTSKYIRSTVNNQTVDRIINEWIANSGVTFDFHQNESKAANDYDATIFASGGQRNKVKIIKERSNKQPNFSPASYISAISPLNRSKFMDKSDDDKVDDDDDEEEEEIVEIKKSTVKKSVGRKRESMYEKNRKLVLITLILILSYILYSML